MSFVGLVFLLRCFPRIANVILAGEITVACTQLWSWRKASVHCLVVVIGLYATGTSAEQRVEQKKPIQAHAKALPTLRVQTRHVEAKHIFTS